MKLDIGCGKNKKPGFIGVDQYAMEGVDVVINLSEKEHENDCLSRVGGKCDCNGGKYKPWPWEDNSIEEVHCSHFIEHLTGKERVHFCNELYRVMKPEAKCTLIAPHWASNRAYGDPTHQWPPVAEMWFYYLSKEWRESQAPHTDIKFNPDGFSCDFNATWGYGMHQILQTRNQEFQQFALQMYKESAQDIIATLIKK